MDVRGQGTRKKERLRINGDRQAKKSQGLIVCLQLTIYPRSITTLHWCGLNAMGQYPLSLPGMLNGIPEGICIIQSSGVYCSCCPTLRAFYSDPHKHTLLVCCWPGNKQIVSQLGLVPGSQERETNTVLQLVVMSSVLGRNLSSFSCYQRFSSTGSTYNLLIGMWIWTDRVKLREFYEWEPFISG